MGAELQDLLEKIQRDGVEKANAEAAKIIDDAKVKAASIVKAANDEASAVRAKAEEDAKAFAERAQETIRQAARDTVLRAEEAVTALLNNTLVKNVDAALSDPTAAAALTTEIVKAVVRGEAEIATISKLAETVRAQLAKEAVNGVVVTIDETVGSGFSVRVDNGRIEHSFTGEVVATEIAKRLRPALAALVK